MNRDRKYMANLAAIGVVLLPIALVMGQLLEAKATHSYCTPPDVYQLRPAFGPTPGLTPMASSLPCGQP